MTSAAARVERAVVAWGSNLGDRARHVAEAIAALRALPETRVVGVSRNHETEPVGGPPQGRFLNGVALLDTELSPFRLLDAMAAIEAAAGRQRGIPDGPRTLDLDLLSYGDRILHTERLALPHPRMAEREFVLAPLAEVAPSWRHPVLHRTAADLLEAARARAVVETGAWQCQGAGR